MKRLLSFRKESAARSVDLNAVVLDLLATLRILAGSDIELQHELCQSLPRIWSDETSIEQMLINLVANARDALPAGGAHRDCHAARACPHYCSPHEAVVLEVERQRYG